MCIYELVKLEKIYNEIRGAIMKRQGFTLWEIIVILIILALLAVILYPVFLRPHRGGGRKTVCCNNLKQLALALVQYQQDYNRHTPLVGLANKPKGKTPYGWADALFPYVKHRWLYHCSSEPHWGNDDPTKTSYADYWLNSNLSGFSLSRFKADTAKVIAFGDGNDGGDLTDARYNLPALPAAWINDLKSPAYRHKGRANYLFLDGHVKALPPDQITNEPLTNGKSTFAVK